jgi:hypothetical protein
MMPKDMQLACRIRGEYVTLGKTGAEIRADRDAERASMQLLE